MAALRFRLLVGRVDCLARQVASVAIGDSHGAGSRGDRTTERDWRR